MASASAERHIKNVAITGIQKRYKPSRYYVYLIRVKWTDRTSYVIYRSYSAFFEFHNELVDRFPVEGGLLSEKERVIPKFPRRKFYQNTEMHKFAVQYQASMENYCKTIIDLKPKISRHPFVLSFFELTPEDLNPPEEEKKPPKMSSLLRALTPFWLKKENREPFHVLDISSPMHMDEYRSIENYKAEVTGQISLKKGDIVGVIEKNPSGWWMVDASGRQGWAPGSYLEKVPAHGVPLDTPTQPEINLDGEIYVTLMKYDAHLKDEVGFEAGCTVLVLQKRLDGWWIIKYNKNIGYAPAAYLVEYKNADYAATPMASQDLKEASTPLPSFVQVMLDRQISTRRRKNSGTYLRVQGAQMNLPIPKRRCTVTKEDSPSSERVLALVRRLSENRTSSRPKLDGSYVNEEVIAKHRSKPSADDAENAVFTPQTSVEANYVNDDAAVPYINVIPPTLEASKKESNPNQPKSMIRMSRSMENVRIQPMVKENEYATDPAENSPQKLESTAGSSLTYATKRLVGDSTQALAGSEDSFSRQSDFSNYVVSSSPLDISESLVKVVKDMQTPTQNLYETFKAPENQGSKPVGNVRPLGRATNERVQKWIDDLKTPENFEPSPILAEAGSSEFRFPQESTIQAMAAVASVDPIPRRHSTNEAPINSIIDRLMKVADNLKVELDQVRKDKSISQEFINEANTAARNAVFVDPVADIPKAEVPKPVVNDGATHYSPLPGQDFSRDLTDLPQNVQKSVLKMIGDCSSPLADDKYTITVSVKRRTASD